MKILNLNIVLAFLTVLSYTISIEVNAQKPSNSDEKQDLFISDGSLFQTKESYPRFSWDITPLYCMFGDGDRVLEPKEVSFIADRSDFICIEKSHGEKMLGAAELGAKHEASAFKKVKEDINVLFYFNSAWAWPFTSYSKNFTLEKIDEHPELKKFLLINPETGELNRRGSTLSFDVLNPEFREWWVNTVAKGVEESGCDGVFIDQMHGFVWLRQERQDDIERAMGDMMGALKKKIGPEKILLGNNAHDDQAKHVFPVVDAIMFEHYNFELINKENLLKDWDNMLRIAKAGKMSIFRIGVEVEPNSHEGNKEQNRDQQMEDLSKERAEFYLSCYLIGAQPFSYFQYGWGWNLSSGSLVDYPELSKPLGVPLGAYKRKSSESWVFTRDFKHASVWVDTEKREGKITWR